MSVLVSRGFYALQANWSQERNMLVWDTAWNHSLTDFPSYFPWSGGILEIVAAVENLQDGVSLCCDGLQA